MGGNPSAVHMAGPLQPYTAGFALELARAGYTANSTADQLRLFASESLAGS
jgi:hypothetical protein